MTTIIQRKVTPDIVSRIFSSNIVNIRLYEPVGVFRGNHIDMQKPIAYNITIRHGEEEEPEKLFDDVVNKMQKGERKVIIRPLSTPVRRGIGAPTSAEAVLLSLWIGLVALIMLLVYSCTPVVEPECAYEVELYESPPLSSGETQQRIFIYAENPVDKPSYNNQSFTRPWCRHLDGWRTNTDVDSSAARHQITYEGCTTIIQIN